MIAQLNKFWVLGFMHSGALIPYVAIQLAAARASNQWEAVACPAVECEAVDLRVPELCVSV